MVGRDQELEALERSWRSAGQLIVIQGAAGIGKSRLVREFASKVRDSGGIVLTGRCSPTAIDVPLRPLREALLTGDRSGLHPSEALRPFLPALGGVVPNWAGSADPGADRGSIMLAEGLLRLMAQWSTTPKSATVLVIEDLHWSDPETLKVLEYLADNLAGQPALVVATIREGEAGAGNDLVSALEARRAVVSIDVGPLDRSQSEEVLRECLAVEIVPADLLEAVVLRSDGVPFFIEELLASALADPSGGVVPASIGTALEGRLALLPDGTAQLVRYAAVWAASPLALGCRCLAIPARGRDRCAPPGDQRSADRQGRRNVSVPSCPHRRGRSKIPASRRRQRISAELSQTLETLHPGLEGELCQLAANLAEIAGDAVGAAGLWLDAAQRALGEGSLTSAEALALRALSTPHRGRPAAALDVGAGRATSPGSGGRRTNPRVQGRSRHPN